MLDVLRKYMDSLVGITEMPRDRAEKLVRDLQRRGEVRARDISKTAQELVDRSVRNRRELVRLVQKEIGRQVQALGLVTRDEVDKLAGRVAKLEKKPQPAKRSSSAKASGSKRTGAPKGAQASGSED